MQQKIAMFPTKQTAGTGQASNHHLPMPLTPLVGREPELAKISTLLQRPDVGSGTIEKDE